MKSINCYLRLNKIQKNHEKLFFLTIVMFLCDLQEKLFSGINNTKASLGKKLKNDMLPEIEKVQKVIDFQLALIVKADYLWWSLDVRFVIDCGFK